MTCLSTGILTGALALGCNSAITPESTNNANAAIDITSTEDGGIAGKIDPNEQSTIKAEDGELAGAGVTVPAGTLGVESTVMIVPGEELASEANAAALGLGDLIAAGPAMNVNSEPVSPIAGAIAVESPLYPGLNLVTPLDRLIVIYKIPKPDGGTQIGYLTRDKIQLAPGAAGFNVSAFGGYQLVIPSEDAPGTEPVDSSSPLLSKADALALGAMTWSSTSAVLEGSTATFSGVLEGLGDIDFCVAIVDRDKVKPFDVRYRVGNVPTFNFIAESEGEYFGRFQCIGVDGRTSPLSPWTDGLALTPPDSVPRALAPAVLYSLPKNPSRDTELAVRVGGMGVVGYRYAVAPGDGQCSRSALGDPVPVATAISDSLGGDGLYRLCVIGIDADNREQEEFTRHVWLKSSNSPVAVVGGMPDPATNAAGLRVSAADQPSFTIGGVDITHYSYKVRMDPPNCEDPQGYSAQFPISQAVEPNLSAIPADTMFTLCVMGRDSDRVWQDVTAATAEPWMKGNPVDYDDVEPDPAATDDTLVLASTVAGEVSVSWNAASDNVTAEADLTYYVHWSTSDELAAVTDPLNGTEFTSGQNLTAANITGLTDYGMPIYVNVFVEDEAGNRAAYTTDSVTLMSNVLVLINDPGTAWSGDETAFTIDGTCTENGQPVALSVDDANGGTAPVTDTPTCTAGMWTSTIDVSTLDEGTLTATADHDDGGGLMSPQANFAFEKDTQVGPLDLGLLAVVFSGNETSYTVSGVCEYDSVGSVTVTFSDSVNPDVVDTVDCSGGMFSSTTDVSSLNDVLLNVTADHTDEFGNTGQDIDTVAKDTVVSPITLAAIADINGANVATYTINGTCEDDGMNNVSVVATASPAMPVSDNMINCSGGAWSTTLNLATLPDGTNNVSITVGHTDDAGNTDTAADTASKDAAADVSITAVADIFSGNAATYSLSGTCETDGTDNVTVTADDSVNPVVSDATIDCSGGAWSASLNVTSLNDGSNNISVSVNHTDAAGNPGTDSDTASKDTVVTPLTIGVTPVVNSGNVASYSLSGTCEDDGSDNVTVTADDSSNPVVSDNTVDCSGGAWSASLNLTTLDDGPTSITFIAQHTDDFGNTDSVNRLAIEKDVVVSPITLAALSAINGANAASYGVSGTCEDDGGSNVTVTASDSSNPDVTDSAVGCTGGAWSTSLNVSSLIDGTITITAAHTDDAGNTDSDDDSTTKDALAGVTLTGPANIDSSNQAVYAIGGTCEDDGTNNITITVSDGSNPDVTDNTIDCSGSAWSATPNVASLSDGTANITVTVQHMDDEGNTGSDSGLGNVNKDTVALVTLVSPAAINLANENSYGLSGTCESDGPGNVTYSIDDVGNPGSSAVTGAVACSGSAWMVTGLDVSGLDDGTLDVNVDHTDAVGNNDAVADTAGKDTVVTFTNSALSVINVTNAASYTVTGTCEDDGAANVSYSIDDASLTGPVAGTAACSGGSYSISGLNLTGLNDELITFTLDYTDDEGNTAQLTPTAAKDTGVLFTNGAMADINSTNENSVGITGTCEDDGAGRVAYSYDDTNGGTTAVAGTVNCTGGSYTITGVDVSSLDDDTITLTLDYTDDEGNAAQLVPSAGKDTAVTFTNGAMTNINSANQGSVGITGACEDDGAGRVAYSYDDTNGGTTAVSGTVACTGGSYTIAGVNVSSLDDDTITLTLDYTDDEGNAAQQQPTATKDTVVTFTNNTMVGINAGNVTSVGITGTCEDDGAGRVAYSYDDTNGGTAAVSGSVACTGNNYTISGVNLSSLDDDVITLTLDYTDDEGNSDQLTPSAAKDTGVTFTAGTFNAINSTNETSFSITGGTCEDDGAGRVAYSFDDTNGGTAAVAGTVNCTGGSYTISGINLSTLDDDAITLTLDYTDDESNVAQLTPGSTKDTVVTFTNSTMTDLNATSEVNAGATGTCEDDGAGRVAYSFDDTNGGTPPVTGTVGCSGGNYTIVGVNVSGLDDDVITLTLDYTDDEGNTAQLTPSRTKDTDVTFTNGAMAAINSTNESSVGITGACEDDGPGRVAYSYDDTNGGTTAVSGTVACTGGGYTIAGVDVSSLDDDNITLTLDYTDDAGNSDQLTPTATKDTVASFSNNALTTLNNASAGSYTLTGSCEDDGSNNVDYSINDVSGNGPVTGSVNCSSGTFSVSGLNLTGLADETITFTLNYTDDEGNAALTLSPSTLKDTVVSPLTISTVDDANLANQTAITVAGSCENDGASTVTVDATEGSNPITTQNIACTGGSYSTTINVSAMNDGTDHITVTVGHTDAVGNFDSESDFISKDVGAAVSLNAVPDVFSGNAASYPVSGTCEDDGTDNVTVAIDDTSTTITDATIDCTGGSWSANLNITTLNEGLVTVNVSHTDDETNTGNDSDTATKDTLVVVTLNSPATVIAANVASYPISGTCEDNGSSNVGVAVSDSVNPPVQDFAIDCSGNAWSTNLNLSTLDDGSGNITITVAHTDDAGNSDGPDQTISKDVDVDLTLATVADANAGNETSISVSGTCESDGASNVSVDATDGSNPISTQNIACSGNSYSTTIDVSAMVDGSDHITVTVGHTDDETNFDTRSDTISKDTGAGITLAAVADITAANQSALSVSGTCEDDGTDNVTVVVSDGSNPNVTDNTIDCSGGGWSTSLNVSSLNEGPSVVTITASHTDDESNTDSAPSDTVDKDTVAGVTLDALTTINAISSLTYSTSGTCEHVASSNVSVTFSDASNPDVIDSGIDCTGAGIWSASTDISSLDDGSITVTVSHTDSYANTDTASLGTNKDTEVTLTIDSLPVVDSSNVAAYGWTGDCELDGSNNVIFSIQDGSGTVPGTVNCSGGGYTVPAQNLSGMNEGNLTFYVTHTDAAGNPRTLQPQRLKDTIADVSITPDPGTINLANAGAYTVAGTCEFDGINNVILQVTNTTTAGTTASCSGGIFSGAFNVAAVSDGVGIVSVDATHTDAYGNMDTSTVSVTKDAVAPTVNAGPALNIGVATQITGSSASDSGSGVASYAWSKTVGSGTVSFAPNATVLNPTVSADNNESYTLQLTVTDNAGNQASDTVALNWSAVTDDYDPTLDIVDIQPHVEHVEGGSGANSGDRYTVSVGEGEMAAISLAALDEDGTFPTINCTGLPAGFTAIDQQLDRIIVKPGDGDDGSYDFYCYATDGSAPDSGNVFFRVNVDDDIVLGNAPTCGDIGGYVLGATGNVGCWALAYPNNSCDSVCTALDPASTCNSTTIYDEVGGGQGSNATCRDAILEIDGFYAENITNNAADQVTSNAYGCGWRQSNNSKRWLSGSVSCSYSNSNWAGLCACDLPPPDNSKPWLAFGTLSGITDFQVNSGRMNDPHRITVSSAQTNGRVYVNLYDPDGGTPSLACTGLPAGGTFSASGPAYIEINGGMLSPGATSGVFSCKANDGTDDAEKIHHFVAVYIDATTIDRLAFEQSSPTQSTAGCGALSVQVQTPSAFVGAASSAVAVGLSSDSGSGNFYVDPLCSVALPGDAVEIPPFKSRTKKVFYKDSSVGNHELTATDLGSGLTNGTVTISITANNAPTWTSAAGVGFDVFTGSGTGPYSFSVDEDEEATITVTATDSNSDTMVVDCSLDNEPWVEGFGIPGDFSISVEPGVGVASTGGDGGNGTGSFDCWVDDGGLTSATVTFNYSITSASGPISGNVSGTQVGSPADEDFWGDITSVKSDNGDAIYITRDDHESGTGFDQVNIYHSVGGGAFAISHVYNAVDGTGVEIWDVDAAADDDGNFWVAITENSSAVGDFRVTVLRYCRAGSGQSGCSGPGWSPMLSETVSAAGGGQPANKPTGNCSGNCAMKSQVSIGVAKDGDHVAVATFHDGNGSASFVHELIVNRWAGAGFLGWENPATTGGIGLPQYEDFNSVLNVTNSYAAQSKDRWLYMADNGDFWVAVANSAQVYLGRFCRTTATAGCVAADTWLPFESVAAAGSGPVGFVKVDGNPTDSEEVGVVVGLADETLASVRRGGSWYEQQLLAGAPASSALGDISMNASGEALAIGYFETGINSTANENLVSREFSTAWSNDISITGLEAGHYADVYLDNAGTGVVIYSSLRNATGTRVAFREYAAGVWGGESLLFPGYFAASVDIAECRDGTGYVIWGESSTVNDAQIKARAYE